MVIVKEVECKAGVYDRDIDSMAAFEGGLSAYDSAQSRERATGDGPSMCSVSLKDADRSTVLLFKWRINVTSRACLFDSYGC